MYRVGVEEIVGFRKVGDTLRIEPCVPEGWAELGVEYRHGAATYSILVTLPGLLRSRGARVTLDGAVLDAGTIPLVDDGARHVVRLEPLPDGQGPNTRP